MARAKSLLFIGSEVFTNPSVLESDQSIDKLLVDTVEKYTSARDTTPNTTAASIFTSYIRILEDPTLKSAIVQAQNSGSSLAESVISVFDSHISHFSQTASEEVSNGIDDLETIKSDLLTLLQGDSGISKTVVSAPTFLYLEKVSIYDVFYAHKHPLILGIVSNHCNLTSHAAILSRSFGIPHLTKVQLDESQLSDSGELILDCGDGKLFLNADNSTIDVYDAQMKSDSSPRCVKSSTGPTKTYDGKEVKIQVNADIEEVIESAKDLGCDGIGLFRSENLLLSSNILPNLDEQRSAYVAASHSAFPLSVNVRLFDFGSDKFSHIIGFEEPNPSLGLRGIRFLIWDYKKSIHKPSSILYTQLQAILEANIDKNNLTILIPFVIKVSEVLLVKEIINQIQLSLQIISNMKVGVMIETPAAAILADRLAEISDYLSIGSNDLTQYVLAADRTNNNLGQYYRWLDTSILKLIIQVIDSAKATGKSISICGEVASNIKAIPILLWSGLDNLSVNIARYSKVKTAVENYSDEKFNSIVESLISKNDDADLISLIDEFIVDDNR